MAMAALTCAYISHNSTFLLLPVEEARRQFQKSIYSNFFLNCDLRDWKSFRLSINWFSSNRIVGIYGYVYEENCFVHVLDTVLIFAACLTLYMYKYSLTYSNFKSIAVQYVNILIKEFILSLIFSYWALSVSWANVFT